VKEERSRPLGDFAWLGSMLWVYCSSFTIFGWASILVGLQEGHSAHKNPLPLISRGSLLKQAEEEGTGTPRFTS